MVLIESIQDVQNRILLQPRKRVDRHANRMVHALDPLATHG